jgi:hypothetical protein
MRFLLSQPETRSRSNASSQLSRIEVRCWSLPAGRLGEGRRVRRHPGGVAVGSSQAHRAASDSCDPCAGFTDSDGLENLQRVDLGPMEEASPATPSGKAADLSNHRHSAWRQAVKEGRQSHDHARTVSRITSGRDQIPSSTLILLFSHTTILGPSSLSSGWSLSGDCMGADGCTRPLHAQPRSSRHMKAKLRVQTSTPAATLSTVPLHGGQACA